MRHAIGQKSMPVIIGDTIFFEPIFTKEGYPKGITISPIFYGNYPSLQEMQIHPLMINHNNDFPSKVETCLNHIPKISRLGKR